MQTNKPRRVRRKKHQASGGGNKRGSVDAPRYGIRVNAHHGLILAGVTDGDVADGVSSMRVIGRRMGADRETGEGSSLGCGAHGGPCW